METPSTPTGRAAAEAVVTGFVAQLRAGNITAAIDRLENPRYVSAVVQRPGLVHVLLDRTYRYDDALMKAPEIERVVLVTRLAEIAEDAAAAAPDDVRTCWALALVEVLRARTSPSEDAGEWLRAAELLEQADELNPGEGEALSFAVSILLEGACTTPDQRHALQKRADALTRRALTHHADAAALAHNLAASHLWAARTLVPTERRAAKSALLVALGALRPHVGASPAPRESASLFNDALTFAKSNGYVVKDRYLTEPADALGGTLHFAVPISSRWAVTKVEETEDAPEYVYVTETDAAGARLCQVIFRRYVWGQTYTFAGGKEVRGDNVKNIVRSLAELTSIQVFSPGAKVGKVAKHRLTDELSGHSFRIQGRTWDEAAAPLRVLGYGARGHNQATFVVLVYDYRDGDDDDVGPEMKVLLASMREPEE